MLFDATKFYEELDGYFYRHDTCATEKFLLETLEGLENSMLISTECSSCGGSCPDDSCPSEEEIAWAVERSQGMIAVLNELACFYRGLSRWDDSLKAFSRVMAEMELCGLEESDNYALVIINTAGTYRLLAKYNEALEAFDRAKEILDKNGNNNAYNYASLYNNAGLVYQDLKNYPKAVEYLEKALDYLPHTDANKAEAATNLSNLAMAYYNMGNIGEADKKIDASIEIFKDLDGGLNPHYGGALNTKAFICFNAGDTAGAAVKFEKAADITKLIFGENREYAIACRNCAYAYDRLGNREKAEHYRGLAEKVNM
jgi:tetratricopeptide (TPR) repeat protein